MSIAAEIMNLSEAVIPNGTTALTAEHSGTVSEELKNLLERAYGVQFAVFDGATGELLEASADQPARDWTALAELCREVARRGAPEFLEDDDPFLTLALPLIDSEGVETVAVATFLSRPVNDGEDLSRQANRLGMRPEEAVNWARSQIAWPIETLQRINDVVLENARAREQIASLQREAEKLSVNLASTYEEISLLYRLTQNLKISKSDEELGHVALEWMEEVIPASGLAILLLPTPNARKAVHRAVRLESVLLRRGECPIDVAGFFDLLAYLKPTTPHHPIVVNRNVTDQPDWPCSGIRQLIAVALAEGENVFGWLAAFNHVEDEEFGTVEASLLSSVAAILGIHGGNIELYRQQSELLRGIVRALTSAIDAKDPYTCGHSDRVARISVRLAEELGCDAKMIDTLYLAGQLHDIGKIGINDSVLRKAGKLSDEEYEHIKQHVQIGHRILEDLSKLEDVLPVVLHHHESWDGGGYPHHLGFEGIPLSARIVAVADAFDAMSSDRPYRKGMPEDQVDRILRGGAGRQWDPDVVEAYFRVRDDIRRICREEQSAARSEHAAQLSPTA